MSKKHLKYKFLLILIVINTLMSCKTSYQEVTLQDDANLDTLVDDLMFEIEAKWANPMPSNAMQQLSNSGLFDFGDNASQINIQNSTAQFYLQKDTVHADLPYFGERQFGGGYSSDEGIKFRTSLKDLNISKNDRKGNYTINFDIKENTEYFDITLTLYPNQRAIISITSSHRNPISYRGVVKKISLHEHK